MSSSLRWWHRPAGGRAQLQYNLWAARTVFYGGKGRPLQGSTVTNPHFKPWFADKRTGTEGKGFTQNCTTEPLWSPASSLTISEPLPHPSLSQGILGGSCLLIWAVPWLTCCTSQIILSVPCCPLHPRALLSCSVFYCPVSESLWSPLSTKPRPSPWPTAHCSTPFCPSFPGTQPQAAPSLHQCFIWSLIFFFFYRAVLPDKNCHDGHILSTPSNHRPQWLASIWNTPEVTEAWDSN